MPSSHGQLLRLLGGTFVSDRENSLYAIGLIAASYPLYRLLKRSPLRLQA